MSNFKHLALLPMVFLSDSSLLYKNEVADFQTKHEIARYVSTPLATADAGADRQALPDCLTTARAHIGHYRQVRFARLCSRCSGGEITTGNNRLVKPSLLRTSVPEFDHHPTRRSVWGFMKLPFPDAQLPPRVRAITNAAGVCNPKAVESLMAINTDIDEDASWPISILDSEKSPVDLSFLNAGEKPAGKHGFLKAVKDKLEFEDGTRVRFWGTNVTSYALFGTSHESVKRHARRLSQLGFNLVRLHHHDSVWVDPNIFGKSTLPHTLKLNDAMLEKIDWWIKCLKDEGIYIWLDLHVQRHLKQADGIDGFDEIGKGDSHADLKGYNYVNPSIQQAMMHFNEDYVLRINTYTGTQYRDEPAIAAMLITNENDVTNHFGNSLLPGKQIPIHSTEYMNRANTFAIEKGLSKKKVWKAWEHGPAKLFLNDLERRFNTKMIDHLRQRGVKVPIVTTSTWGFNPLSSLPALTTGNIIDVHTYGGVGEIKTNPLNTPNLIHWIAAAQVTGNPLSVSEWNVSPFPVRDRHSIPLFIAAAASHQGWDALMQYAYSEMPLDSPGRPSNWHAYNDPAMLATLPAAALMYRQEHIQEARTIYAFAPSKGQLFGHWISPHNAALLRTAPERGKLVIALPETSELPWLKASGIPDGAIVITNPNRSIIDRDAARVVTDTNELTHDWTLGTYSINTPRSQGITGKIGNQYFSFPNLDVSITTNNASVMAQSMDDKNISESRKILFSLGAQAKLGAPDKLPFRSQPVVGRLTVRAREGLKLFRRDPVSGKERSYPVSYENGRYSITLDTNLRTHWLVLK